MINQVLANYKMQLKIVAYMSSPLIIILLQLEVMLSPKLVFFF
jgi:hypothetical protein